MSNRLLKNYRQASWDQRPLLEEVQKVHRLWVQTAIGQDYAWWWEWSVLMSQECNAVIALHCHWTLRWWLPVSDRSFLSHFCTACWHLFWTCSHFRLPSKNPPDICREAWPIEIHMLDAAALANRPCAASRPWCILARTWTWHSTLDMLHKVDLPNHGKFLNAESMDPMASYGVSRHNSSNRGSAFGLCWTAGLPLEHLKTWWHRMRNSRYNPWVSACNAAQLSEVRGGYSRMLLKKC